MRRDTPKGLTPPDWVYSCITRATLDITRHVRLSLSPSLHSIPVDELGRGDGLVVHEIVVLGHLPRPPHQEPVVWPHPTVHHPDVLGDLLYLVSGMVLEQDGFVLLLSGEDHSVDGLEIKVVSQVRGLVSLPHLDPHTGGAASHGLQGVLDLHQLAAGAEGGEGEAVPL